MTYAIRKGAAWRELLPGVPVIIGDVATSYATMLAWSPQYRTAQSIKAIEEDPIPVGKVRVGESSIGDRNGKPVRVWNLEDAPAQQIEIPVSVTMRQARLALLAAGVLDQAEAALAAMQGSTGRAAQIEWEYAAELRRDHPLITSLGSSLGLNNAAIDALFIQAANIV